MAYANWLTPSTDHGSGNGTVNVTANSSNTGRNARSTTLTFTAVGVDAVVRTVNQAGKPENAVFEDSSASSPQSGGTLTLSGTSNSSILTFSKGTDNIGVTIPETYTAAGQTTNNGSAITGDPGASQEYSWSISLSIPANTQAEPLTCQIVVTDNAGHNNTCTITLAAGAATLSVSPVSVDLPWDGSTSASFEVTSNTSWTIS